MTGNEQGYFLPVDESGCEVKMINTLQPRMVCMVINNCQGLGIVRVENIYQVEMEMEMEMAFSRCV
jgi:hypothetical protein